MKIYIDYCTGVEDDVVTAKFGNYGFYGEWMYY